MKLYSSVLLPVGRSFDSDYFFLQLVNLFDHRHLRKGYNPGHENATPILPTRKNFKVKFGNVEYQRQNFPLALAYAITAWKAQGLTLEEVIVDFGPDLIQKIKNFICPGGFYVAITRIRERMNGGWYPNSILMGRIPRRSLLKVLLSTIVSGLTR